MKIDSNHVSALIGVLGTLLGVLLGAVLNRLSRFGKIKVFQNSVSVIFREKGSMGEFRETTEMTENTNSIIIKLDFDFYNSSELSPKIARNIKFCIMGRCGNYEKRLQDDNQRKATPNAIIERDLIHINIGPKQVSNYMLSFYDDENIQKILNSDWYLTFRSDKGKLVKVKINKSLLRKD